MKCPNCQTKFSLTKQIKEWEKSYGNEALISSDFPIMIAIECYKCGIIANIYIEQITKKEFIKSKDGKKVEINF